MIISSLQGTFLRGTFPSIVSLIPKCEKIKKLSAICKLCKDKASFTFRHADANCEKLIGGENMYMPLCRQCHERESAKHAGNQFMGDPTVISVKVEEEEGKPASSEPPSSKEVSTESSSPMSQDSAKPHMAVRDLLTV